MSMALKISLVKIILSFFWAVFIFPFEIIITIICSPILVAYRAYAQLKYIWRDKYKVGDRDSSFDIIDKLGRKLNETFIWKKKD